MTSKNSWRVYPHTFYASAASPSNPPNCISLKAYCAKYFLSKYQVLNRLRKRQICAISFKKKLFVVDAEPVEN
ncbi:hypothetical protein QUB49_35490 [Microcoleus sp. AT9_B4]